VKLPRETVAVLVTVALALSSSGLFPYVPVFVASGAVVVLSLVYASDSITGARARYVSSVIVVVSLTYVLLSTSNDLLLQTLSMGGITTAVLAVVVRRDNRWIAPVVGTVSLAVAAAVGLARGGVVLPVIFGVGCVVLGYVSIRAKAETQ
jgi:hypothetical protein